MTKEKTCFVCDQISNNKKLDIDFITELDKIINEGCKIDELNILYNELFLKYNQKVDLPSEYHLKNHQVKCLKLNLKDLYDKRKFDKKLIENHNINNCAVCNQIINNYDLNIDFKNELEKFIKTGCKLDELISFYNEKNVMYEQVVTIPNKYHLEKHQKECLKLDLKTLREKRKLEKEFENENIENNEEENSFYDDLDLKNKIKLFSDKSFEEQEIDHLNRLREIKYMCGIIIHYEILNGKKFVKGIIPKEDITALKNIEDIIKNNDTNINDMEEKFVSEEDKEELAKSYLEFRNKKDV